MDYYSDQRNCLTVHNHKQLTNSTLPVKMKPLSLNETCFIFTAGDKTYA